VDRLTIDRLRGQCLVPRDHPAPEQVRLRLEDALAPNRLAPALAAAFQGVQPPESGVWFIRRLELQMALSLERIEVETLAEIVARQLARGLHTKMNSGGSDPDVIFFPGRPAYIAQFVADCAAGYGWNRWYFESFDGLSSLQPHQALREAILREPAHTEAVLRELAGMGRLDDVLARLTERDKERVYAALLGPAGQGRGASRRAAEQLLAIWPGVSFSPEWTGAENRLRLWLAWREQIGDAPAELPATIDLLLRLARTLRHRPGPPQWLKDRTRAGRRTGGASQDIETLADMQALAAGDEAWLRRATHVIAPQLPDVELPAVAPRLLSAGAGLFLLLSTLIDLRIVTLLQGRAPDEETAAVWLYWLLVKCMGRERAERLRDDPAILTAAGLTSAPSKGTRRRAEQAGTPDRLAALESAFAQVLQAKGHLSGRSLAVDRASSLIVLREMEADYWLAIVESEEEMSAALAGVEGALGQGPAHIWDMREPSPPDVPADFRAKAKPLAPALDYLSLPFLPPSLDRTLSLFAQAVLRTFARRLMGFGWSSAGYLYDNLLAGQGAIRRMPAEIIVELPHAPLHQVLSLAGFHRSTLTIPWLVDRPVTLLLSSRDRP